MHVCIYVCMYVCIYASMHVFMYDVCMYVRHSVHNVCFGMHTNHMNYFTLDLHLMLDMCQVLRYTC